MLTKLEWSIIKGTLQFSSGSHTTPCDWNASAERIQHSESKLKTLTSFACFLSTLAYAIFVTAQFPSAVHDPSFHAADLLMHIICILWYCSQAVWRFTLEYQAHTELTSLINRQVAFNKTQGLKHFSQEYLPANKRGLIFRQVMINHFCIGLIWAAFFLVAKDHYFFAYSALPSTWKANWWTTAILAGFELGFLYVYFPHHCVHIITHYIYLVGTNFWLTHVCVLWPKSELLKSSSAQSTSSQLKIAFHTYRCLELLSKQYNECFAHVVVPLVKIVAIISATMTIYAVIKFGLTVHLFLGAMFASLVCLYVGCLLIMCGLGSSLYDKTRKFQVNYGYVISKLPLAKQKYYRRLSKACASFGFRVGGFYLIKKVTLISVVNLLFNATVFLLITY